ncbi:unnamed protein product [Rhizophagus irregularis]|nr:unnamed protein product [Rhizophagus irregularis]
MGLETIHNKSFMHRDFHSGNILFDSDDTYKNGKWKTGDLGLSQACSSNYSSSTIPFGNNTNTIRIGSLSSQNLNSNYISAELELDIESLSSTNSKFSDLFRKEEN